MIENIAYIFGLSETQYNSIKESGKSSDKLNPYMVLESSPEDDLQTMIVNYIKLQYPLTRFCASLGGIGHIFTKRKMPIGSTLMRWYLAWALGRAKTRNCPTGRCCK